MKVLVTGAGGNLGRVAIPALLEGGHAVRAFDEREVGHDVESLRGDVRDADAVARAVAGVDAVVHAAALHGVHLRRFAPADFWSVNATGTFNVYEAALAAGVERAVLCSTMAVYGAGARGGDGWAIVTEDSPVLPNDVYGLSKALCEQLARYHARTGAVRTTALRLGMFVPETFVRYGFRLLFGGVDDRDAGQAVVLALAHEPRGGFAVFDVMADTPFDADDARLLAAEPAAALDRRWPGSVALARDRGVALEDVLWGRALWPVEKAKRELGYRPRYGFDAFLDAWRRGDESHYPFAGLRQWGLD